MGRVPVSVGRTGLLVVRQACAVWAPWGARLFCFSRREGSRPSGGLAECRELRRDFTHVLKTSNCSTDLCFAGVGGNTDVDPNVEMFSRRAGAMRRVITKDEGAKKMAEEIYDRYV